MELDYRPAAFCLTNTLTRRPEAYHKIILEHEGNNGKGDGDQQPASIHDIVRMKEEGLTEYLNYDKYHRRVFQDHFIGSDVTLDNFARSDYAELGDFADNEYEITDIENYELEAAITLRRESRVYIGGVAHPVAVEKKYVINGEDATLTATYNVINIGNEKIECGFGVQLNLTLLAGYAKDRYWTGDGISGKPPLVDMGEAKSATSVGMRDEWAKFEAIVSTDAPCTIWRHPVETVSQSESGFERIYQGSSVLLLNSLLISPEDEMKFVVTLNIKDNS
jgi:alpha-amylase